MPSVYLNRREQLMVDRLAGVNRLSANMVLRLALHQLYAQADADGRLPLAGPSVERLDPVSGLPLAARIADEALGQLRGDA